MVESFINRIYHTHKILVGEEEILVMNPIQNISYTQDMTGTGDYLTVSSEPLTPDEEKEWDRVYQKQVEESQKRGKENI